MGERIDYAALARQARSDGFDDVAEWLASLGVGKLRRATPAPAVSGERWEATEGLGIAAPYRDTGYQMLIATFIQQDKRDRAVQCVNALAGIENPEAAVRAVKEALEQTKRFLTWREEEDSGTYLCVTEALALLGGEG